MKYQIGEICEIVSGSTPKTSIAEYWDGNVKWITPAELDDDSYVIQDTVRKITELGVKKTGLTILPKGTVLFSSRAPIGKVAIAGCDMYCNQGFKNLICSDVISNKYLYWYLKSKTTYLNSLGRGATFKELSKKILAEVELEVPHIKRQNEIVQKLERVCSIKKKRLEQLQKLDELIQARFVELFGDPALNPNGWEKVNLGSVCDVRDGTHDSPKYFTEGYPLVTSKNVTSGRIDFTDCSLICEEDYKKINERSKVDFGDILMPMIGTVGKPVIVDVDAEFAIKNVALIKFYDDSKVINIFVRALLQSDYFDRAVISRIRGGTQKFIALGDIRKLEICLPPMATQLAFREFAHQVHKSKLVIKNLLQIYKHQIQM